MQQCADQAVMVGSDEMGACVCDVRQDNHFNVCIATGYSAEIKEYKAPKRFSTPRYAPQSPAKPGLPLLSYN